MTEKEMQWQLKKNILIKENMLTIGIKKEAIQLGVAIPLDGLPVCIHMLLKQAPKGGQKIQVC